MTDSTKATPARTARYFNIGKIILALLLVWFVVSKTDLTQLHIVLESLSMSWLLVYLVLFILAVLSKALQYRIVIGDEVTYPRVLNVVIMQNVVSNFLAASAGIASYVVLLRVEHGVKVSRAMIAFILTKIGDLTAIFCLLLVSIWSVWGSIGGVQWLAVVLLTGMGTFLLIFFLVVIFRQRFVVILKSLFERMHLARFNWIQQSLNIMEALARQDQADILQKMRRVLAGSFLYLAVTLPWIYAGLRMFNIRLGVWEVAFSSAFYYLVTYVPIQIFGGLGVTEASMMYLYHLFGPSQAELAAVLIGLRVLSALMNLVLLLYLPIYGVLFKNSETNT